jgi:hypothetical protein
MGRAIGDAGEQNQMTHFLIQKDANSKLPMYGFCYETIKSIEFNNWISQNKNYKYTLITLEQLSNISTEWYMNHRIKNRVPVGSVEFVHKYMEVCGLPIPAPINIPEELFGLCVHNPYNVTLNGSALTHLPQKEFYIKSNDVVKHSSNGKYGKFTLGFNDSNWQVTDSVKITSEWRCFVFKNKLIDIKCYAGDAFIIPDEPYIDLCIKAYETAPIAYTLDLAVCFSENPFKYDETVIEVHNMYSCGFYGFEGKYPALMQAAWWNEYLRSKGR